MSKRLLFLALLLWLGNYSVSAQSFIAGTLSTKNGSPIPRYIVSLYDAKGNKMENITNKQGLFRFELIKLDTNSQLVFNHKELGYYPYSVRVSVESSFIVRLAAKDDMDKDSISDLTDECPNEPGIPEMRGCPDSDEDGITDARDKCPYAPGRVENDGCPEIAESIKIEPGELNYVKIPVFYATDRNLTSSLDPNKQFGTKRAKISYGVCEVSIPKDHKKGDLEEPSIWRFEFKEDPSKHVMLLKVDVNSKESFFESIKKKVEKSPEKNAFIFVHGYNVSFKDAARRTGQMSYDLGFKGAPVFYSWPSQANLPGYNIDEGNIEWSQRNMKAFLEGFLKNSTAEKVYLIAHSMGNRGLTRALASIISENPKLTSRIQAIILAAPDIDADVFKEDIAPQLAKSKKYIALYTSSKDKALMASQKFSSYPRAGQAGNDMVIVPGIETIDASNVKADFLNHSYFSQAPSVLSDIYHIIKEGKKSSERAGLKRYKKREKEYYWKFGK